MNKFNLSGKIKRPKEFRVEDDVAKSFEKLHLKNLCGRPVYGAFDTISCLLATAFGNLIPNPELIVLDVGSAAGYRTRNFFLGFNLILLDCSKTALKEAMRDELAMENPKSKATYLLADYFDIPLADESVDYVVAIGINEHYRDPQRQELFQEMYRLVKKGGKLVVIVPNRLNPFHTIKKFVLEAKGMWLYGPQYDFSPFELNSRVRKLGFKRIEFFGVGFFTSWIRLFSNELQKKLVREPTPFLKFNKILSKLDSKTTSFINRIFGREIMVVGQKEI